MGWESQGRRRVKRHAHSLNMDESVRYAGADLDLEFVCSQPSFAAETTAGGVRCLGCDSLPVGQEMCSRSVLP